VEKNQIFSPVVVSQAATAYKKRGLCITTGHLNAMGLHQVCSVTRGLANVRCARSSAAKARSVGASLVDGGKRPHGLWPFFKTQSSGANGVQAAAVPAAPRGSRQKNTGKSTS